MSVSADFAELIAEKLDAHPDASKHTTPAPTVVNIYSTGES